MRFMATIGAVPDLGGSSLRSARRLLLPDALLVALEDPGQFVEIVLERQEYSVALAEADPRRVVAVLKGLYVASQRRGGADQPVEVGNTHDDEKEDIAGRKRGRHDQEVPGLLLDESLEGLRRVGSHRLVDAVVGEVGVDRECSREGDRHEQQVEGELELNERLQQTQRPATRVERVPAVAHGALSCCVHIGWTGPPLKPSPPPLGYSGAPRRPLIPGGMGNSAC